MASSSCAPVIGTTSATSSYCRASCRATASSKAAPVEVRAQPADRVVGRAAVDHSALRPSPGPRRTRRPSAASPAPRRRRNRPACRPCRTARRRTACEIHAPQFILALRGKGVPVIVGADRARAARWRVAADVLDQVRRRPGITRAELARRLRLSSGSATEITARLRELRLLTEAPAPVARARPADRGAVRAPGRSAGAGRASCATRTGAARRSGWTGRLEPVTRRRTTATRDRVLAAIAAEIDAARRATGRAGPGGLAGRRRDRARRAAGAVGHAWAGGRSSWPGSPRCRCWSATTPPWPGWPRRAPARPPAPAPRCT